MEWAEMSPCNTNKHPSITAAHAIFILWPCELQFFFSANHHICARCYRFMEMPFPSFNISIRRLFTLLIWVLFPFPN